MSLNDWLLLIQVLIVLACIMIVVGMLFAVFGKLNAPDDDDPETINILPPMDDFNDWDRK